MDNLIIYMIKTWPNRYPEKMNFYIEIIENILTNHNKIKEELKKKILKKICFCVKNTNFLVNLNLNRSPIKHSFCLGKR